MIPGGDGGTYGEPGRLQDKDGKDIHLGEFWDYENKKWGEAAFEEGGETDLCVYPELVDWDGDGDLDLLLGGYRGSVGLRLNEGTPEAAAFAAKTEFLSAAGAPLSVGAAVSTAAVDWDGDGKLDLVCGNSRGEISWFKNTADKKGSPTLGEKTVLSKTAAGRPGSYLRINAEDYDGDGKLDLVVGAYDKDRKPGIWVYLHE